MKKPLRLFRISRFLDGKATIPPFGKLWNSASASSKISWFSKEKEQYHCFENLLKGSYGSSTKILIFKGKWTSPFWKIIKKPLRLSQKFQFFEGKSTVQPFGKLWISASASFFQILDTIELFDHFYVLCSNLKTTTSKFRYYYGLTVRPLVEFKECPHFVSFRSYLFRNLGVHILSLLEVICSEI